MSLLPVIVLRLIGFRATADRAGRCIFMLDPVAAGVA
jgi:hypothetical protein